MLPGAANLMPQVVALMAIRGTAMDHSQIRNHTRRNLRRHVIASSFAAMLIVAGGIGHALAEDDDDELPDTKFFKSLMTGLGLKKDGVQKSGIDYQERAPLVVPPNRDLPPPQAIDPAQANALWPQDQDEKRRKEAATKRKKDSRTTVWEDLGRQMTPEELRKGATTAKDEALSKRSADNPEAYQQQYKPSELGYVGGLFGNMKDFFAGNNKDETAKFEAEPPRASLTDPPSGYRSPSAAQPYGITADKSKSKTVGQDDRVNVGTGSQSR
jgi:hypothetical protein